MPKLLRLLAIWAFVYPLVTGLIYITQVLDLRLPMPRQTLILTAILVPVISLIIAPRVARLFGDGR